MVQETMQPAHVSLWPPCLPVAVAFGLVWPPCLQRGPKSVGERAPVLIGISVRLWRNLGVYTDDRAAAIDYTGDMDHAACNSNRFAR